MRKLVVLAAAILLALSVTAAGSVHRTALPTTTITVNGNGGDRVYDGVGAILGGGGNARYLEDYPAAQQSQIMDYLFQPGYGASLQLLKLEIGGDANSSAGAEPSIEHTQGTINCAAGWEFAIAKQAVALNPNLELYGLQWGAPGWVGQPTSSGGTTLFTTADITYLIDWLNCAKQDGLTISYLGGWNERDYNGANATWYSELRTALNNAGYKNVQIVAGDSGGSSSWEYTSDSDIAILGAHDNCGYPTGTAGPNTVCSSTAAAQASGKPLWGSELGAMDAGAQTGCKIPCAPAMDRAWAREYLADQTTGAKVTGVLEWPVIDSMPADVLPYENRGLVTADQPWSGSYNVNAMTWAIAQITQFVWPPRASNPGGWKFEDSSSGYLQGAMADGSYDTLIRSGGTDWSTIVEATTATAPQQVTFDVTGGNGLANMTVHEWSSNFDFNTDSPSQWFVQQPDITPVNGQFTVTIQPGYVYSFTTTTGQGHGTATGPAPSDLQLPYSNDLSSGADGEPTMLDAQDGSFELAPCTAPDGSTTCAEQTTVGQPVLWSQTSGRHPYALIGSDWDNYTVSVDCMVPQAGSAGLIGRFNSVNAAGGTFDGYVFDVNTDGTYTLTVNSGGTAAYTMSGQRSVAAPRRTVLARGTLPRGAKAFAAGAWHTLSMSISGTSITASIDGTQVATASDSTLMSGMPGIEVGGWYPAYFSNLTVTNP
jgi:hypothetical protein